LPAFAPYRGSVTACPGRGRAPAGRPPAACRPPMGHLRASYGLTPGWLRAGPGRRPGGISCCPASVRSASRPSTAAPGRASYIP